MVHVDDMECISRLRDSLLGYGYLVVSYNIDFDTLILSHCTTSTFYDLDRFLLQLFVAIEDSELVKLLSVSDIILWLAAKGHIVSNSKLWSLDTMIKRRLRG